MRKSHDLFAEERNLRLVFRNVEKNQSLPVILLVLESCWRAATNALPRFSFRTFAK